MDKDVFHITNEILLSHKKEQIVSMSAYMLTYSVMSESL